MKRILTLALATIMAVSMLAACSSTPPATSSPASDAPAPASSASAAEAPAPSGNPAEITFGLWDEVQSPVFQQILDKFTAENPDIKVKLQLTPWSDYWTKLDAAAGAGNAPDVFWINSFLPKYVDAGVIQELDEYIARDGIDLSQWVDATTQMFNYNGKQYGMPKGMDVVNVYYNKAIFEQYGVDAPKEGWTWADMVTIGETLRDNIKSGGGSEYPIVMELDQQPSYYNFIWQEGGFVISPDRKESGFGKPESIKALQDVVDLIKSGVMPEYKVLSDTKGTDLFISGKAAIVFAGSWKASVIDESSIAANVGVITMPKKSANNDTVLGGLSYVINANSKDTEACWTLVKYLAGNESNKMQAEAKIDIPALKEAQQYYAPNFKNIDANQIFKASENAYPFPTSNTLAEWYGATDEVIQSVWAGTVTAEDGGAQANAIMQEILDQ